jgi:hypothetical protein
MLDLLLVAASMEGPERREEKRREEKRREEKRREERSTPTRPSANTIGRLSPES